jgi:hypothetical protein
MLIADREVNVVCAPLSSKSPRPYMPQRMHVESIVTMHRLFSPEPSRMSPPLNRVRGMMHCMLHCECGTLHRLLSLEPRMSPSQNRAWYA